MKFEITIIKSWLNDNEALFRLRNVMQLILHGIDKINSPAAYEHYLPNDVMKQLYGKLSEKQIKQYLNVVVDEKLKNHEGLLIKDLKQVSSQQLIEDLKTVRLD